ncbi:MAG: IclR family transcriptional regulator C-terminal domain-containing protein [Ardenticatenia bacterium]|nr:IclR family transcriptional regulator C-terminal domain-containing protein [Ardenticatenia bacterium]
MPSTSTPWNPRRRLLARTAIGERVLLHCTAVGKAILAALAPEEVEGFIRRQGLVAFTEHTLTDPEALREELSRVRELGFAVDRGEHEVGTYCVGAAIYTATGRILGSCSVSGTDPDIIGVRLEELSARVMHVADEISRRMGYVPPRLSAVPEVLRR